MSDAQASYDAVGRTVGGRYFLEAVLGRGGMAVVYRARDAHTGKPVALKRGIARHPRQRKRNEALLSREYHTLCQLAHPRIIEVYDYGVDEDGPYYVMELLGGSDLERSDRLPWREACALLRDVASSLAILHARGLIHRDVSARNVRRTPDGRVKLIDFGAMSSMGVPKEIVGTPPFMAPEVLQMQALDGRADLFSLGALAYRLITGSHAYPARRTSDLRDAWRSRPRAPSRCVPDVPRALSDLVVQLLSIDRNARPHSAAEVMGRLCAIAELPLEEQLAVSHAYLTAPSLIGRERALVAVRKRLLSLARGDGGALLIEGEPGSGRSRLLDACAIEAKLIGAAVLRADAGDGAHGDFGVMRALCSQLVRLLPEEAEAAARLSRDVLAAVLDDLPGEPEPAPPHAMPERDRLVRELRDFVLALARKQRLLIAIDDFERIDEPSSAVLGALAYKAERHPIVVALAIDRHSDLVASPALRLICSVAEPVAVERLSEPQTEALVRSVFGDVPNLQLVAGRIHNLAQGSPRTIMELAQHLVTTGIARYRAGAFALPDRLRDDELPETLLSSLVQRLRRLSPDARELCEVLCIADADAPTVDVYPRLTAEGDENRIFKAIDELIAARVLIADGDRYRFSQPGFVVAVANTLTPERAASLHARVADWLTETGTNPVPRAHHLLESGGARDREAIELLASQASQVQYAPLSMLERALERAEHHRMSVRAITRLRFILVTQAQGIPDIPKFLLHVRPLLEQLEHDSGLALYRELAHLPEPERLAKALAQTSERYESTPEHERGYSVAEALPELGRVAMMFHAVGVNSFDLDFWNSAPSLAPFASLSPAMSLVERFGEASQAWVRGQFGRSIAIYRELLDRVEQPDGAGLSPAALERVRVGLHLLLGLRGAVTGDEDAEAHARVLDRHPLVRVSAWRVRQCMHLSRGDIAEARRCMRRAEVLQLQVGGEQHAVSSTFAIELMSLALAGDAVELRAAIERVALLVERQPGWRPILKYGQIRLRELQGDPGGALEQLVSALELARPGRHWAFGLLAPRHIALLIELGRTAEACATAREYLAECERHDLMEGYGVQVGLTVAHALAVHGEHEEAVRLAEDMLARLQERSSAAVQCGVAYEIRARIALAAGDAAGFERFAELCGREFCRAKNPVLLARFARLVEAGPATTRGPALAADVRDALTSEYLDSEYATIYSRIEECGDRADRARCALTILLQHLESFAGYLYAVNDSGPALLAGVPDGEPEAELDAWLQSWTAAEIASLAAEFETSNGEDPQRSLPPDRYTDQEGRRFVPRLLFGKVGQESRLAGVLVTHVERLEPRRLDRELGTRIATQLLEHGDIEGVFVQEIGTQPGGVIAGVRRRCELGGLRPPRRAQNSQPCEVEGGSIRAMVHIDGFVAPGYERVREAFAHNFEAHGEVGAAVAAWADGREVISLWGGSADAQRGAPFERDTLVLVFSMTKALTTTCVHHLAERGGLDLDASVARYWPEFGQNGKQGITVRMLLAHRAGLPLVEGDFTLDEALSWTKMVDALARQAPLWPPDTAHGYHLRTFGWLVGEVFRRASGRSVGRYFAQEIAAPLGLDWHLGLPPSCEPRVARLVPPPPAFHEQLARARDLLIARATSTPSDRFRYDDMWNERKLREVELPSSNSVGTAASVARLYAALLWPDDGKRVLSREALEAACVCRSRGPDRVLLQETAFGSGYQVFPSLPRPAGPRAFGHGGAGGSMAFADPEAGLAFAYTPTRLRFDVRPDPRIETLAQALYAAHRAR